MQPCALTLAKHQKKTNIWPVLGLQGPWGQNKVATLQFMTKSRLLTKQGRRQKPWSGSPFSKIVQIPEKRGCVYSNLVRLLPPSILRRFRSCTPDLQTISDWPLSGQTGTKLFRIALKAQNTSFKGQVFLAIAIQLYQITTKLKFMKDNNKNCQTQNGPEGLVLLLK